MFNDMNQYTLQTEVIEGITHYFISFADGQALPRQIEVSRPVYLEFLRLVKQERNLRRSDERHMAQINLTDEMLDNLTLYQPKSAEEVTLDSLRNEHFRQAIQDLPEIQKRRFVLYHEFGLTYEQIAEIEGCTKVSAYRTVSKAEEKIKAVMKSFHQ